ncbi:hypothetical protein ACFCWG_20805 [Streptomyces sp. NPDC056390]|uniref:hypothetical protein n=1 Tax=Streptomyces sp. NPDC056390 TaxID=3345806 RepID=UPI0035D8ED92
MFSLTACQGGGKDAASGSEGNVPSSASPSTGDVGTPSGAKSGADKTRSSTRTATPAPHRRTGRQGQNDGAVDAAAEANQRDAGLDANGVYIVLSAGGVISAHEESAHEESAHEESAHE